MTRRRCCACGEAITGPAWTPDGGDPHCHACAALGAPGDRWRTARAHEREAMGQASAWLCVVWFILVVGALIASTGALLGWWTP